MYVLGSDHVALEFVAFCFDGVDFDRQNVHPFGTNRLKWGGKRERVGEGDMSMVFLRMGGFGFPSQDEISAGPGKRTACEMGDTLV